MKLCILKYSIIDTSATKSFCNKILYLYLTCWLFVWGSDCLITVYLYKLLGESSEIVDDKAADRRAGFVDSLLNVNITDAVPPAELMNSPLKETCQEPGGNENSVSVTADPKARSMFIGLLTFTLMIDLCLLILCTES